jgi:hypothetical protein
MNVGRFHVSSIQETDYRAHFTCGGLLDFLEHCKHIGQWVNPIRLSANCVRAFPKDQKLCTHAHRHDRSATAAVFANGTYFVYTPHTTDQDAFLVKILYRTAAFIQIRDDSEVKYELRKTLGLLP